MTMRRLFAVLPAVLMVLMAVSQASALSSFTQSFKPVDATGAGDSNYNDLEDLDHYYAYRWGLNYSIPAGYDLAGARLIFKDIRNWDSNPNRLYLRLLDTTSGMVGVTKFSDNANDNTFDDYFDDFVGNDIHLHTYQNLSTTAATQTYTLDAAELGTLATYMADGYFGFGFDPDCHYWNNGITLKLDFVPTPGGGAPDPSVPEPVTASLGLLSAAGLFLATHRRRNA